MNSEDPADIIRQRAELRSARRPPVNTFAQAGILFTVVFIGIFVVGMGIFLSWVVGGVAYFLVHQYNQRCIRDRMRAYRLRGIGDDFAEPVSRRPRRR